MSPEFHFLRPTWLLALLPCFVMVFFILKHKLQQGNWTNVCDAELLPYLLQQKPVKESRLGIFSGSLAAILVIFALAGPTWERLPTPVFRNDSGLVLLLDLSRSMEASDVKPSRLIRARYKIADILQQRKDGQTALIVYAGDAFTVTPLTEDTATIESQLEALNPAIMPITGSNAHLAIQKAVELLKNSGLQAGQILLITDDVKVENTLETVQALGQYQLSILAVGTEQGAPIKNTQGGFLKDAQGNIVVPKLDLTSLQQLTRAGGGLLQMISTDDSDVKNLLQAVDKSVQNSGDKSADNLLLDQWDDKGAWLLLFVLPLVLLNFRRGVLSVAFLILIPFSENSYALEWQDLWKTQNQQAQEAYQKNDFSQAAEKFEDKNWKASAQYKVGEYDKVLETLKEPTTADGFYNQANALAKSGQLAEAVEAYKQALKLNSDDEDTKYNKALVEKELEKQQKEQDKKDQQKQDEKSDEDKEGQDSKDQKPSEDGKPQDSKDSKEGQKDSEQEESEKQDSKQQQKSEEEKSAEEKKSEQQQAKELEEKVPEKSEEQQAQAQQAKMEEQESEQANEQWLNRIKDDPAALLRRKFKHQYGLRKRKPKADEQQW